MLKLFSLLIAGSILLTPCVALAASQSIAESQARGDSGTIATIKLGLNSGLPIKLPQGYRAYKGWLDNDIAEVDSDRPFEQGASIIYLVARTRGSAKLSLMVRDGNGVDHLFLFRLTSGAKGAPDFVAVKGGTSAMAARVEASSDKPSELIYAGLRRSGLPEGSELYQAIVRFSSLVDSGVPADTASAQTGLDLAVIRKLIKMGQGPKLEEARVLPVPSTPKVAVKEPLPAPPATEPIEVAALPEVSQPKQPKKPKKSKRKPDLVLAIASSMPMPNAVAAPMAIAAPPPKPMGKPQALTNHQRANRLVLGLLKAPRRDYVRGQIAIVLLRRNASLSLAAKKSGLSVKTLESYIDKGGKRVSKV